MGVTITANNSKLSFDSGYGGFFNLRKNIAKAYDDEFGELYAALIYYKTPEERELFDKVLEDMLSDERFKDEDNDILDFLFASDCSGKIKYRTCGKIYDIIKDVDFEGKTFQYGSIATKNDYNNFKTFLKECYSHRRNMVWR